MPCAQTNANAFISANYPDMKPFYDRAPTAVLKSDILRVMILDKLGGVWLDIDTEVSA
jgi:mannosyltransferase OCH1-like enzyme